MKQPKVQIPDPAPPVFVPKGPRYRYFTDPPSVVTVRAGDLLGDIPDAIRVLGCDTEFAIEFPASEIFQGAVPGISLRRLVELAPDCFQLAGLPDRQIPLPAARLALSYRMVTGRELIEDEVPAFAPPPLVEEETENIAEADQPESKADEVKIEEAATEIDPAVESQSPFEPTPVVEDEKPEPLPAAAIPPPPIDFSPPAPIEPTPATPIQPPPPPPLDPPKPIDEAPAAPPIVPLVDPPKPAEEAAVLPSPEPTPPADPGPKPPAPTLPTARSGLFSMLPIFRRKTQPAPVAEKPPRPRVELPPPRVAAHHPFEVIDVIDPPAEPPPAESIPAAQKIEEPTALEISQPAAQEPPPPPPPAAPKDEDAPLPPPDPPISAALVVEPEHLPKEKPHQSGGGEIPDHEGLQALFHTEDFLTVDRVVELCGGLPGINSCVLSHGAAVIASHNVPDSIDLVSLSAHALEMLRAMRESSAKMGIGAVPAVTIHSEKGPITFFHQEDLCLLVLHKDKGFVPGVREKLQNVVSELAKARLQRPLSSSPPRTIEG